MCDMCGATVKRTLEDIRHEMEQARRQIANAETWLRQLHAEERAFLKRLGILTDKEVPGGIRN